jgi:hypothetical protein
VGEVRWTAGELRAAGIDGRKLAALLRKFAACVRVMEELGLSVYGESGIGYLIHHSRPEHRPDGSADLGAVVADIGRGFDGGGW